MRASRSAAVPPGGAFAGTNVVYVPAGAGGISAIPFIHLSSGSVSAPGAISAITALALTYPDAYCWFPANSLSAAHAAGWFYCTFSGTTAGTAFLNTYTSGVPVIPTSPTAVSAGQGAFTSDTTTHNGPTVSLPANSLGINGRLRLQLETAYTNSAGTKLITLSFGGAAFAPNTQTTSLYVNMEYVVANRGAANKQTGNIMGGNGAGAIANLAPTLAAVDTTAAQNIIIQFTKNTATDNLILDRYSMEVMFSN